MNNKNYKVFISICGVYCLLSIAVFLAKFEGGIAVFYMQFVAPFSLFLQFAEFVLITQGFVSAIAAMAVNLLLWCIVTALATVSLKKSKRWSILVYVILSLDAVTNLFLMNLFGLAGEVALILLLRNALKNDNV